MHTKVASNYPALHIPRSSHCSEDTTKGPRPSKSIGRDRRTILWLGQRVATENDILRKDRSRGMEYDSLPTATSLSIPSSSSPHGLRSKNSTEKQTASP